MAKRNPFIDQTADDLSQLEQRFCLSTPEAALEPATVSVPVVPIVPAPVTETPPLLEALEQNQPLLDKLADLISHKLLATMETKQLWLDKSKLEELKVDNQLMAKHIYTLLQKRDLQEKQLTHLQQECGNMRKLFWKFYIKVS